MSEEQQAKDEQLNREVAQLNKELLEHNMRITLQNEAMAQVEHEKKIQLFDLQRMQLVQALRVPEIEMVESARQFHKLFKHPIADTPVIPEEKVWRLRIKLLREEVDELEEAYEEGNLVKMADGCGDIGYILGGTILVSGLASKMVAVFEEIHRSNMTKACDTEEEAKATIKHYESEGIKSNYIISEGKFLVIGEDGKVLKSVKYSKAALAPILGLD